MQERYPKMRNLTRIARMCSERAIVAGIECTIKNSGEVLRKGMAKSRLQGLPLSNSSLLGDHTGRVLLPDPLLMLGMLCNDDALRHSGDGRRW
jgi:hypothetical protein